MTGFEQDLDDLFGDRTSPQGVAEASLAIDIAVQFAALRERRGLSQREVAERLGRTQQAVSKIERPTHNGHNLARLKEAVAVLDAYLDVTIVPLEDAAAYEALYPPKPVLEDLGARLREVGVDSPAVFGNGVAGTGAVNGRRWRATGDLRRSWRRRHERVRARTA
jgi:transcriptional regulator with XRE-family HTH domain